MTRRERLLSTLAGKAVDRPAFSFYELNGLDEDTGSADPFNIYSHPSWKPLIDLAREKTDRMVMRSVPFRDAAPLPGDEWTATAEFIDDNGSRHRTMRLALPDRELISRQRIDHDINTVWTVEHLLKSVDDLRAWLARPETGFTGTPDIASVLAAEEQLGDTGIVLLDTPDPLCLAASLFSMEEFTVVALTLQPLFREALDRCARAILPRIRAVAQVLPGRLWRIYGPEYASPPYLPPSLFHDYVAHYDAQIVRIIQAGGGFARVHSHGNLREIIDDIALTGCDGLDPIEPPPQGDVDLAWVRLNHGRNLVLFGNLEISDIECLPTPQFRGKVVRAIEEGTSGRGRGFVLMPSSCPYGRVLSPLCMRNYEAMIDVIEGL
jgi:hypothetical protein